MFCQNCDNLRDISKTSIKINTTTYSDDYIKSITDLIINNKQPTNINTDIATNIMKSDYYNQLTKAQQKVITTTLNTYIDSEIISNMAYYKCPQCGAFEPIVAGSLVMTIENHIKNEVPKSVIYNIEHCNLEPYTTNYLCPNDKCEAHTVSKNSKKPARFIKQDIKITYICPYCNHYWIN